MSRDRDDDDDNNAPEMAGAADTPKKKRKRSGWFRDRDAGILNWTLRGHGDNPPPAIAAAFRARDRELEIERNENFAEPYATDDGYTGNTADLVPELYQAAKALDGKLGGMNARALTRRGLADAIETKVFPLTADPWTRKLPTRLREARPGCSVGYRVRDGKTRVMWDGKMGQARLCPDDAREDAERMKRRVVDPILALKKNGCQVTYCVFTLPNYQPGQLRAGLKAIYRRFNALLKRQKDGRLQFHQIRGALCVLEAPLGPARDWHVHLNVLLVHDGFIDWREFRKAWHWNVELERVRGGRDELEESLRELIKYSVQAMPEKSAEKARPRLDRNGNPLRPAPPMVEWSGPELLEWLQAFRGFRRTRTYREMFRLPKPLPDDPSGFVWVGGARWEGQGGFRWRIGPLESIPGDKSTIPDHLERWFRYVAMLKPRRWCDPPAWSTRKAGHGRHGS